MGDLFTDGVLPALLLGTLWPIFMPFVWLFGFVEYTIAKRRGYQLSKEEVKKLQTIYCIVLMLILVVIAGIANFIY